MLLRLIPEPEKGKDLFVDDVGRQHAQVLIRLQREAFTEGLKLALGQARESLVEKLRTKRESDMSV